MAKKSNIVDTVAGNIEHFFGTKPKIWNLSQFTANGKTYKMFDTIPVIVLKPYKQFGKIVVKKGEHAYVQIIPGPTFCMMSYGYGTWKANAKPGIDFDWTTTPIPPNSTLHKFKLRA